MGDRRQIVHRYMNGFRRSDHEAVLGLLTEDVVWNIHGMRTTRGKAEFDAAAAQAPDAVMRETAQLRAAYIAAETQDLAALRTRLQPLIDEAHALGVRVSLFMDPLPGQMAGARATGAERVELYTETYAAAHGTPRQADVLAGFTAAAEAALAVGLELNAGHDLNRANLTDFLRAVPGVLEVSIGHALIADALELGMAETIRVYQRCIQRAFAASA